MAPRKPTVPPQPPSIVQYGRLGVLNVYEISEAELEKLENGPPGQTQLSFALALLPAALTVFITIQTVDIKPNRIYYGYWIAFWLLLVQGLLALARWWAASGALKSLTQDIRSRVPAQPGIPEQVTNDIPNSGGEAHPS